MRVESVKSCLRKALNNNRMIPSGLIWRRLGERIWWRIGLQLGIRVYQCLRIGERR